MKIMKMVREFEALFKIFDSLNLGLVERVRKVYWQATSKPTRHV
ncbi:MAG: hypothetical protein QXO32_06795 [Candidatus Bathyarchaeia archaeon]